MAVKKIKKYTGEGLVLPDAGIVPKASVEPPQESLEETVETAPPAPEVKEDSAITLENNSVKYGQQLVDQALDLSRSQSFCTVSFDYSQLELLQRSLKVAEIRSTQLSQLLELLQKRKIAFEALTGNVQDVLGGVSQQLDNLKKLIPDVEIK